MLLSVIRERIWVNYGEDCSCWVIWVSPLNRMVFVMKDCGSYEIVFAAILALVLAVVFAEIDALLLVFPVILVFMIFDEFVLLVVVLLILILLLLVVLFYITPYKSLLVSSFTSPIIPITKFVTLICPLTIQYVLLLYM